MALLMVLLLLSLTVGLCYAAMRTQATSGMVQRNSDRRASARQAAITGLSIAMKKMCRNDWDGVDTTLIGSLGANDRFQVTYTTGDPRLASSDPDYPYRVTLLSTGYSADIDQPQAVAIYRVRAVVRLIPRNLADEPADWTTMMAYTVYQWTFGAFTMAVPARIEGPVRAQAVMNLALDYYWRGDPRDNFYKDLHAMQEAGRGDYRPFTGPVTLDKSWNQFFSDASNVLTYYLGVTVNNASNRTVAGMTFPASLSTYRLYPGGKEYTVPQLPSTVQATTYQADPAANPAGLFQCLGTLTISDDTTIHGTIIMPQGGGGRLYVAGRRVTLQAVNLPPLEGTTNPVQLPVAIVGDSFQVGPNADLAITGLVSAYNSFEVLADNHLDINMSYQGKLIAQSISFDGRSDWYKSSYWWSHQYDTYHLQEYQFNGYKYFPEWLLRQQSLDYRPKLVIKPDPAAVRYHWPGARRDLRRPARRRRPPLGPSGLDGKPMIRPFQGPPYEP